MLIAAGCVMFTCIVLLQPLASVTVQVYEPAVSPFAVGALPPDGAQAKL
jgi:hypothetical protein